MYRHVNKRNNQKSPLVADDVYQIIMKVRADGNIAGPIALLPYQHGR